MLIRVKRSSVLRWYLGYSVASKYSQQALARHLNTLQKILRTSSVTTRNLSRHHPPDNLTVVPNCE